MQQTPSGLSNSGPLSAFMRRAPSGHLYGGPQPSLQSVGSGFVFVMAAWSGSQSVGLGCFHTAGTGQALSRFQSDPAAAPVYIEPKLGFVRRASRSVERMRKDVVKKKVVKDPFLQVPIMVPFQKP